MSSRLHETAFRPETAPGAPHLRTRVRALVFVLGLVLISMGSGCAGTGEGLSDTFDALRDAPGTPLSTHVLKGESWADFKEAVWMLTADRSWDRDARWRYGRHLR